MKEVKNNKHCLKCLLREMDENAFFENLHTYIKNLDEDIKATQEVYEERLKICKECDYLEQGMCKACGCFVELRAAIAGNVCSYSKW